MNAPHPYKSTTHEETFVHIPFAGEERELNGMTIFLRKEEGTWYATDARCSLEDQFSRRVGRQVARRRFFRWPEDRLSFGTEKPSYDDVLKEFTAA